jgi:hypothetical protein
LRPQVRRVLQDFIDRGEEIDLNKVLDRLGAR